MEEMAEVEGSPRRAEMDEKGKGECLVESSESSPPPRR